MKTNCLIILAAALITTACSDKEKKYDATGTFEATEVTVSAQENGCLLSFNIDEGSKVSLGTQVGLIDTVQLQLKARQLGATRESFASQRPNTRAQIAATRQQLAKAIQEQHRFEILVRDDAANRKQLDDAVSNVRVLQRQLEAQLSSLGNSTQSLNSQMSATEIQKYQVLDQLSKCHITTPITGIVLDKYVEQGEFVTTGKPLFKVADTDNMFLRAYITSAQLSMVKIGQHVKVCSDYGDNKGREYQGTVTWISSRSEFTPKTILNEDERADLVYAVKIAVKNDGYVKIGMYGRVKLN